MHASNEATIIDYVQVPLAHIRKYNQCRSFVCWSCADTHYPKQENVWEIIISRVCTFANGMMQFLPIFAGLVSQAIMLPTVQYQ